MFELIFGLVWTAFTILVGAAFGTSMSSNGVSANNNSFFVLGVLFLFIAVGIFLIIKGAVKLFKNSQTNKYGVERYALIEDVVPTGSYLNNKPELKAKMCVVMKYDETEEFEEVIGFNPICDVGDFVLVKQYNGDVNIIKVLTENEIPYDKKEILLKNKSSCAEKRIGHYTSPADLEDVEGEFIIINGEKYKKIK